jgi:ankyrin repeat protein
MREMKIRGTPLDSSAKVNRKTKDGTTALMRAVSGCGSVEIAKLLLARGANVRANNSQGGTALSLAIKSGRPERVGLLRRFVGAPR